METNEIRLRLNNIEIKIDKIMEILNEDIEDDEDILSEKDIEEIEKEIDNEKRNSGKSRIKQTNE